MTTAKLYYESHVTVDPLNGEILEAFKSVCAKYTFRVADLIMIKPGYGETPSVRDSFCTGHGTDLEDISSRTKNLVLDVKKINIKVRRYKIEDTILDSRNVDVFGLINAQS